MILQSLVKLAEREGLVDDPNFELREVHWVIHLKPDGRFVQLQTLLRPPARGKGKARGLKLLIPRHSGRTSGDKSEFLVDKAEYVFGFGERDAAKLAVRHKLFRDEVAALERVSGHPSVTAVHRFLADLAQIALAQRQLAQLVADKELESNHLFAFKVEDDVEYVHRLGPVVAYWKAMRDRREGIAIEGQCLVTGQVAPLADKHPPIKRVPGGSTSGVAVVTFNSNAFESYGFDRNENAPVSRASAEAYTTALNRLLDPSWVDPRNQSVTLPKQMVRLSDDTAAVFWTDSDDRFAAALAPALEGADQTALDALGIRLDPELFPAEGAAAVETPKQVSDMLSAAWDGSKPLDIAETSTFRLLILSGGQGRATIRAYHADTTRKVVTSVRQWFDDVAMVGLQRSPALWRLITSLAVRGEASALPPGLASEVFLHIVFGEALPLSVLEAALRRCRSEPHRRVTAERAALIRAVLRRGSARFQRNFGVHYLEVQPAMNEDERNKGYLLGRMFACVERMQELASGDVGASVTDRYFSAACATPQAVFPRLLKTEIHHFRKARDGRFGGAAIVTHRLIDQLATWLVGEQNGIAQGEAIEGFLRRTAGKNLAGFPAFLPLPEQGLFVLGYHQQRAEFFTPREKAPTAERA